MERKLRRFLAAVIFMAMTAVISVYAEPMPETGGAMGGAGDIRDYEGIITDEVMEGWETAYDTENPTDIYGNEMEWDMQGSGNEDGAGRETDADMMEAPTYSAREQKEVKESLQTANDGTETAGKGWLRIRGEMGEDWPGYNITVALYDSNHKRMEMTLYSQNDFETKRELPVGNYKVYRAYVPGDESGANYPLVISDSSIEVELNKATELTVWRTIDISKKSELTKPEYQKGPEWETPPSRTQTDICVIAGIGAVLLIVMLVALIVYRKKISHHRYQ